MLSEQLFIFYYMICKERPQITKKKIHLKDCCSLKIETAWHLENRCSLKFRTFLVHVYKNGVCKHTFNEVSGKKDVTFFVPEIYEHKSDDEYKVCVEGVRECDGFGIYSKYEKVHPNSIEKCKSH